MTFLMAFGIINAEILDVKDTDGICVYNNFGAKRCIIGKTAIFARINGH